MDNKSESLCAWSVSQYRNKTMRGVLWGPPAKGVRSRNWGKKELVLGEDRAEIAKEKTHSIETVPGDRVCGLDDSNGQGRKKLYDNGFSWPNYSLVSRILNYTLFVHDLWRHRSYFLNLYRPTRPTYCLFKPSLFGVGVLKTFSRWRGQNKKLSFIRN